MKTLLVIGIILSFISIASIVFGAIFKIMHWPLEQIYFLM